MTPAALTAELQVGYAAAAREAQMFDQCTDLSRLKLDNQLCELAGRAQARLAWRSEILSLWLGQPQFRAHLAASRQKSAVMRRSYLLQHSGP